MGIAGTIRASLSLALALAFSLPELASQPLRLEGESGQGQTDNQPRSNASGEFTARFNRDGQIGTYSFEAPFSAEYEIRLRYSNDDAPDRLRVLVDGRPAADSFLTERTRSFNGIPGSGWNLFLRSGQLGPLLIRSGARVLTVEVEETEPNGGIEIDYIELTPLRRFDVPLIVYPQLALGAGFEALVIASNSGLEPWNGVLRFVGFTGWSVNGLQSEGSDALSISIPPRATRKFEISAVDPERLTATWLEIEGDIDSLPSNLATSFFYRLSSQGESFSSIGIPASDSATRLLIPVERSLDSGVDTGFAIRTRSDRLLTGEPLQEFTIALLDRQGQQLQQRRGLFLQPRFVSEAFDDLPEEFLGSVSIESPEPLFAVALRQQAAAEGFQLTGVPPLAQRGPEQAALILRFEADPSFVASPQDVQLLWITENAFAVRLEQVGVGLLPASSPSGTFLVPDLDLSTTFRLTALGLDGASVQEEIRVTAF